VRGHGRLAAARELGLTEIPVDYQDYPDEEGELADMVADNRIPEIAETDAGALEDVLAELRDGGYDLLDAGFDEDALATLFAWQPDESAMPDPLPPPPVAGEDTRNVRVQVVCRSPEEVALVHRALRVPADRASQCVFAATDVLKWMEAPA
jgi:hypothetical protein